MKAADEPISIRKIVELLDFSKADVASLARLEKGPDSVERETEYPWHPRGGKVQSTASSERHSKRAEAETKSSQTTNACSA
ncbi:hypothetical protein IFR05_002084 [Cadophora sp. M221]|nr:hypothetical protein IFR05_002084 [Cadophora sp. M221]